MWEWFWRMHRTMQEPGEVETPDRMRGRTHAAGWCRCAPMSRFRARPANPGSGDVRQYGAPLQRHVLPVRDVFEGHGQHRVEPLFQQPSGTSLARPCRDYECDPSLETECANHVRFPERSDEAVGPKHRAFPLR